MLSESRVVSRAVSVANLRVFRHKRMNFAGGNGVKQTVTDRMPIAALIQRRHREDVSYLGDFFIFLNQLSDFIQLFVVEWLAPLMLVRRLRCRRHVLDKKLQFVGKIL